MKKTNYFISLIYMLLSTPIMAQTNNAVNRDFNNNQMHIVTTGNNAYYYNTKDVNEVKFNGGKTIITSTNSESNDIYEGELSEIGYSHSTKPLD